MPGGGMNDATALNGAPELVAQSNVRFCVPKEPQSFHASKQALGVLPMTAHSTRTGLQLRSLVRANGQLELSLVSVPVPDPLPDEVLVRIEASPLNPSDQGLLFGAADMSRRCSRQRATQDSRIRHHASPSHREVSSLFDAG